MVKVSYQQKPYRRSMMQLWGGRVTASPSTETNAGRQILAADPGLPRQPGHCHQRGGRGRRLRPGSQVQPGQRAQPRDAAPDGHRPGSGKAIPPHRRQPGRGHRLRRRREQFRRPGLPLHPSSAQGQGNPFHRRRAQVVPVDEPRRISLRFRRHHEAHAADEDVYAGAQLHAAGDPCRRTALPRHVAAGEPGRPARHRRSGVAAPDRVLRGGADVRLDRRARFPPPRLPTPSARAIIEAIRCRETGAEKCILFNLSGHGICDLGSYDRYLSGELEDFEYPQEKIAQALAELPQIDRADGFGLDFQAQSASEEANAASPRLRSERCPPFASRTTVRQRMGAGGNILRSLAAPRAART